MRRRLFLQVYLTMLAIVVLFGLLASLGWWLSHDNRPDAGFRRDIGAVLLNVLPPPGAAPAEIDAALARLAEHLDGRISVFGQEGELLASIGRPLPAPEKQASGWRTRGGRAFALPLPDGRLVLYRPDRGLGHTPAIGFLVALVLLALAVAIGAWPLARRLARRLERLQTRVEALGAGDLAARVDVEGKDEIAALARSFNSAAERIQALVEAQRDTLAAASHELRTPLARIRMAVELLAENGDPALKARIERDVEDLDELIEEILLASRLSTLERPAHLERIDLQALAAEEAARAGAGFSGEPATIEGEGRLLARLVRNLLENAARHAPGSPRPGGAGGAGRARPAPRARPRPRTAGGGARADLRALLSPRGPAGGRGRRARSRARPQPRPPDRAPPRRRRGLRCARGRRRLLRGQPAGEGPVAGRLTPGSPRFPAVFGRSRR